MAKLRVAVLFGGRSGEHEISIRSAASVIEALDRKRYEVIPAAIDKQGRWLSPAASAALLPDESRQDLSTDTDFRVDPQPGQSVGVDVVFAVLHGTFGEDGTVQGLLELADVAYVSSAITRRYVHAAAESHRQVGIVTADATAFGVSLRRGPGRA